MNLSRYFTLAELSHSPTAVAERIPNLPGDAEAAQLAALCTQVLDPLREALGQPIRVTSGYRGPALNARIRGSTTSQHMKGQAADIQSAAVSVLELFKMVIRMGLPFDQLIFEAKNASTKWVHVSHNPAGNRGKICVAEFDANGRALRFPQVSAEQALAMVDRVTRSSRPGQWPDYVETGDEPEQAAALAPAPTAVAPPAPAVEATAPPPAAKRAAVKKAGAKTAASKKPAPKKAAASPRPAARTPAATKPAGQPAAAKKPAAKKVAAKQVAAKKVARKTLAVKAPAKSRASKPAQKQSAAKKVPARKARA